jgi:hypothetical protein
LGDTLFAQDRELFAVFVRATAWRAGRAFVQFHQQRAARTRAPSVKLMETDLAVVWLQFHRFVGAQSSGGIEFSENLLWLHDEGGYGQRIATTTATGSRPGFNNGIAARKHLGRNDRGNHGDRQQCPQCVLERWFQQGKLQSSARLHRRGRRWRSEERREGSASPYVQRISECALEVNCQ